MTNILKIIMTSFRIIFKIIKIPLGFLFITLALLDFAGVIDNPVSDDSVVPLIGAIIIGISLIYPSSNKKEKSLKTNENLVKEEAPVEEVAEEVVEEEKKDSYFGNYIIAIISALLYTLALGWGLDLILVPLLVSAVIAAIICLISKDKEFSKVFAWTTVITCVMSYLGQSGI